MDGSTHQHIYATNLQQNYGYPLRKPEPNSRLGEPYTTEGLQVGDVGYVDDHGEFIWLFNIKFPLPPGAKLPYEFRDRNLDPPEKLIEFPEPVPERGFDPGMMLLTGVESIVEKQSPTYEFIVRSKTGAMLILPDGATLSKLEGEEKLKEFQQHAAKHAIEWCRYARRDSLYLITEVYKTKSWTLGSFYNGLPDRKILINRRSGDNSTPYLWACPFTVDRRQSPGSNFDVNQTVLIKGFKISVRWDWFPVIERAERSERWFTRFLATLWPIVKSRKCLSRKKVQYFPARNLSQPAHPLDVINRVLLDKNRDAHVAITHDNAWIEMLGQGLSHADLMQEDYLKEFMERECTWYSDPDHNTVYLRSKLGTTNSQPESVYDPEDFSPLSCLNHNPWFAVTNIRLENFDVDHIYAGVCIIIQFGSMKWRTQNKPHANVIEWDDEIMLPTESSLDVLVCGTFQLGSTLGTREICMKQMIYTMNLSGSVHMANFTVGKAKSSTLLITLVQHFLHLEAHPTCNDHSVFIQKTNMGFEALYSNHDEPKEDCLKEAIECFQCALEQCGPDSSCLATALFNLATSKFIWCQANGRYSELNMSIGLYEEVLKLRNSGDPDHPVTLLLLAQALLLRYGQESEESLVTQIEDLLAEIQPDGSRNCQTADAIMHTCRFYQATSSGNLADVDKLLRNLDRHTYAPPYGFFDWPHMLYKLGVVLATRFQLSISLHDLVKSFTLRQGTVDAIVDGHHDQASVVAWLDPSLIRLLEVRGDLTDADILDVLVRLREMVISELSYQDLCPQPHPHHSSLKNVEIDTSAHHSRFGTIEDLERAIAFHREALHLRPQGHSDRSISLDNLALSLSARFYHLGAKEDLDQAITLHRDALDLQPQNHPRHSISLDNLALSLSNRFSQFGVVGDLEEAIAFHRQVLDLRLQGHQDRLVSLNNLALSLHTRFNMFGAPVDLEEAIILTREALKLRPTILPLGYPDRSNSLSTLALCLSTRFNQFGVSEDLEEAILCAREALEDHPPAHPGRSSSLNTLALCLHTRFNQLGLAEDLEQAITFHREVLDLRSQGHPDRPISLDNLALSLSNRFKTSGTTADFEDAIAFAREALELRPQGHPCRSSSLNALTLCLSTRFNQLGLVEDLEEAIVLVREALKLQPRGHPSRSSSLDSLARFLRDRFSLSLQSKDKETLRPSSLYSHSQPNFGLPKNFLLPEHGSSWST